MNCHFMKYALPIAASLCMVAVLALAGCGSKVEADGKAEAPPNAKVEREADANLVKVDHPEQYPLATAGEHDSAPELNVTGSVNPDVSRNIPVISLASGRVIDIHARIGDTVTKDQLLMRVQSSDISQAFSDYRSAVADEVLSRAQLERSKLLFEKGAVAQKDLEVAEDADAKAKITVENAVEKIHVLGADINHPSPIVDIKAPVSGVIVEQNVTASAGVKTLDNSPNLFTIADLSKVWVVCDVYENDLPFVHLDEYADIHLNAYPNLILKGRIGNIGPSLDPNIRTAKVRLEVPNPGVLRLGMFVTATFHGLNKELRATVPANAVLHLHDRDWVYVPAEGGGFRRVEVVGGKMQQGNLQEIISGLHAGQQVVANALVLENTVEQ
ncbi:MAG TPA: efflux RND transporter periplasmic adaptor subunit [Bryobacteraceae bacterium]|nr:efflux RND transporter periplasmic adaptor subunit [Bryobacteraceae bacterium]